MGVGHAGT